MRRLLTVLPLIVFLAVVAYFAGGLRRDPHQLPSALIDQPVPLFDLPPLPGREKGLSSAGLKGEVRLVNVFASWCLPCKIEHPQLMELKQAGVVIEGINYKDRPQDALAWIEENGDPFDGIGADTNGRVGIDWGVYGVPETFVVDGEGRIRYKHVGPLMPDDVEKTILPLMRSLKG